MKVVAVAGGFDPLHLGHLEHIRRAKGLGDILVVITHPDEILEKKKGFCLLPLQDRIEILRSLKYVDRVIVSIDENGTVAKTLRLLQPDIYAKGGDRTPDNMPEEELQAALEVPFEIVYEIGEILGSSTDYVRKAMEKLNRNG